MTIQQEAYEKIKKLPEDGIRLILAMADEIARQHGIFFDSETERGKSEQLENRKKVFQNKMEMREQSTYPKDFDYRKTLEEVVNEKI